MGAVLAAGNGIRFGMPKILAHDGAWLAAAIDALAAAGCDPVVVVAQPCHHLPALLNGVGDVSVRWVAPTTTQLSGSLLAAVDCALAADVDALVLHVVDTPGVNAAVTTRLLAASSTNVRGKLMRAAFRENPGHPVVVGAEHFQQLRADAIANAGDTGAGRYFRTHRGELIECHDVADGADIDFWDGV